ncbi:MAG: hypothetical protein IPK80_09210 [Nannocystis sp.]|nr:hypothetical protein [Nannocystis sp.]
MSRFETAFRNAIANAERDVLLEQIRQNPQMTLAELGKLTTGELGKWLRGLTIGDLLSAGRLAVAAPIAAPVAAPTKPTKPAKPAAKPAAKTAAKTQPPKPTPEEEDDDDDDDDNDSAVSVDTRRPEGRAAYDQAVLSAIESAGASIGAETLRRSVGGTSLQARAALGRLIEAGKITWSGQARGTRYQVAGAA